MKTHKVYVLSFEEMGLYKIGYTTRSAVERAAELSSCLPFDLKAIGEVEVDSKKVERALHLHFEAKQERGEWFRLTEQDIQNILDVTWLERMGLQPKRLPIRISASMERALQLEARMMAWAEEQIDCPHTLEFARISIEDTGKELLESPFSPVLRGFLCVNHLARHHR